MENGAAVLDKFGNVTGGVRSPYIDVPVSTWFGNSTGKSFCMIAGHEAAFEKGRLKELYPSHADYVKRVREDVDRRVRERFLVRADGEEIVEEAKRAVIP